MKSRQDEELESFKTQIDLSQFLTRYGYELDQKRSSTNSLILRHPNDGKLGVSVKGTDRHWVYCSAHDKTDAGTIIDFLRFHDGLNLGQIRKALRPFLSKSLDFGSNLKTNAKNRRIVNPDPNYVQKAWSRMSKLSSGKNEYLNQDRTLPPRVISSHIFQNSIRVDARSNVCFLHRNRKGACGYEIKNRSFTGFSKHGIKGLWNSRCSKQDNQLVFCETAIDALSYASLFGSQNTRFFSTAGCLSHDQQDFIFTAIKKLPSGIVVIAADNDKGGDVLEEAIQDAFNKTGRSDIEIVSHRPSIRGTDWNDVLVAN